MNEEEFIIKFYSNDNEEQFLKDVYSNMQNIEQENKKLKEEVGNLRIRLTIYNSHYGKFKAEGSDKDE